MQVPVFRFKVEFFLLVRLPGGLWTPTLPSFPASLPGANRFENRSW